MTDETLNAIFYNPDHTKRYNPSGKPTGVVLTDFDIMEAKQAIEDLYTEKLKAFAGEVEASIGIHLSIDKSHACRFNDGEQNCDCFINGRNDLRDDFREALKAIKEKAGIE